MYSMIYDVRCINEMYMRNGRGKECGWFLFEKLAALFSNLLRFINLVGYMGYIEIFVFAQALIYNIEKYTVNINQ